MKYRITEETTTHTNRVTYFLEKKYKILWWRWWDKIRIYHDQGISFVEEFETKEEAQGRLKGLMDKITVKIIKQSTNDK